MIKILFLAANPQETDRLQLDEEVRVIDQALRLAEHRDRFDLRQHWAVRVSDLQELLLRHNPHIVHFSGHGEASGEIVLQTDADSGQTVSPDALGDLFGILQTSKGPVNGVRNNVQCVVLNACFSAAQADAMVQRVDCVIGMSDAISDEAARNFSAAFYSALAYECSVLTAFDLACNRIDLTSLPESAVPQLVAPNVDPSELHMVEARESVDDQGQAPGEPPFKGLHFFDQTDADLFFGREALVAQLGDFLRKQPFLAVVGASGSGKSSVVRAGLVPALRRDEPLVDGTPPPDGSKLWPVHIITPNVHPLKQLSASLIRDNDSHLEHAKLMDELAQDARVLDLCVARLLSGGPAKRLLLVVDQFEELFTLCQDRAERKAFVDNLLAAAVPDGVTTVVITLRADFYAHCSAFDNLRQALESQQKYIGPMTREELRRAIEEPARLGGWNFDLGLVNVMLSEVAEEPGALPLLSHALLETWQRRRGHTLTFAGYYDSGGVKGAIAQTAETVFKQQLTPEQQAIAKNIFLRLTEVGEGSEDTRRRVQLDELMPMSDEQATMEAVLQKLADKRLITTYEDEVEVAHEALIREWPTLTAWLDENRDGLRIHRRLSTAAKEWDTLGRNPAELYKGTRLEQALEWETTHDVIFSPLEQEFLDTSRVRAVRQQRLMRLGIGTAVALVLIAISWLGWQQIIRRQNDSAFNRLRAEASQLKEALEPEQSIAKLEAAYAIYDDRFDITSESESIKRYVAEAWLSEAMTFTKALEPENAISKLEAVSVLYPKLFNVEAEIEDIRRHFATEWVREGEKLAAAGDYEGASVKFTEALDLNPPPDAPIYILVESGEFIMSDGRKASVDAFWIRRTEVTNAQYNACVTANACTQPNNSRFENQDWAYHPVTDLSWFQANGYAEWVGGRIPTEAEWEKACRGTDGREYPWGNDPPTYERANFDNYIGTTSKVGSYPDGVSPYQLFDLAGNVWEWTTGDGEIAGPLRGGSFVNNHVVHCSFWGDVDPFIGNVDVGFRVVVAASQGFWNSEKSGNRFSGSSDSAEEATLANTTTPTPAAGTTIPKPSITLSPKGYPAPKLLDVSQNTGYPAPATLTKTTTPTPTGTTMPTPSITLSPEGYPAPKSLDVSQNTGYPAPATLTKTTTPTPAGTTMPMPTVTLSPKGYPAPKSLDVSHDAR